MILNSFPVPVVRCSKLRLLIRGGSFFSNLAVEEVSNHKLLLGRSHFDYVEALLDQTSKPKLGKKGITELFALT